MRQPILIDPTPHHLSSIAGCLDERGFIEAGSDIAQRYLVEPLGLYRGRAAAVLRPTSSNQVASIIQLCGQHRIGVVPYGGGTGVVGGQVCPDGPRPVILSMERMNAIRAVLTEDCAVIAEAGVILADLQQVADGAEKLFPLSLAAEGSCQIGGNLATNAGGVHVLRYGNARDLCIGLEAVLADGSVYSDLEPLRKDNTGYDLRNLLIGSEGTLGVITAATLKLYSWPGEVITAMLAVSSPDDAICLLQNLRDQMGDSISAFELIDELGIAFVAELHPKKPDPLGGRPGWRVLVELTCASDSGSLERFQNLLAELLENDLITDGTIAANESQRAHMWWMRETVPDCIARIGPICSLDVSVPIGKIGALIANGKSAISNINPHLRANSYGHVGDGNIHWNVFAPEGVSAKSYKRFSGQIKTTLQDVVVDLKGSISAEHGIGRLKTEDLAKHGEPAKLQAMRAIKQALDPLGILNPGAVFVD